MELWINIDSSARTQPRQPQIEAMELSKLLKNSWLQVPTYFDSYDLFTIPAQSSHKHLVIYPTYPSNYIQINSKSTDFAAGARQGHTDLPRAESTAKTMYEQGTISKRSAAVTWGCYNMHVRHPTRHHIQVNHFHVAPVWTSGGVQMTIQQNQIHTNSEMGLVDTLYARKHHGVQNMYTAGMSIWVQIKPNIIVK